MSSKSQSICGAKRAMAKGLVSGVMVVRMVWLREVSHLKVPFVGRHSHDVEDRDDVLVAVEVPQQLQFAQDSFCVNVITERIFDLLDRHVLASDSIFGAGHKTIRTIATRLQIRVASIDVELVVSDHDGIEVEGRCHACCCSGS